MKKLLFIAIGLLLGFSFYYFPIDIELSSLFFKKGHGFIYKKYLPLVILHNFVYFLMTLLCFFLGLVILARFYVLRSFDYKLYRKPLYILIACLIGPGIVVNSLIKEYSHRPRPIQTSIFDGDQSYAPAFNFQGTCPGNCSFVSGHASVGFVFFAFSFISRTIKKRLFFLYFASFLGMFFGLGRIIQGAHYLSDIVFSGVFVYITCYVLAKIIKPELESKKDLQRISNPYVKKIIHAFDALS